MKIINLIWNFMYCRIPTSKSDCSILIVPEHSFTNKLIIYFNIIILNFVLYIYIMIKTLNQSSSCCISYSNPWITLHTLSIVWWCRVGVWLLQSFTSRTTKNWRSTPPKSKGSTHIRKRIPTWIENRSPLKLWFEWWYL